MIRQREENVHDCQLIIKLEVVFVLVAAASKLQQQQHNCNFPLFLSWTEIGTSHNSKVRDYKRQIKWIQRIGGDKVNECRWIENRQVAERAARMGWLL